MRVMLDAAASTGSSTSSLVVIVVALAIAAFYIAAVWRIYSKAGRHGWAAIIPIYSTIVLLHICGRSAWWLLLLLIPFVNIVFGIIVLVDLAKSFGKGVGFAMGLLFLSVIFYPILGFGGSEYVGPRGQRVAVPAFAA